MNSMTKILSVSLIAIAGFAFAQTALSPMEAHEAREAHMKLYGPQLKVLGDMAKGDTAYDAAAAQAAADKLLELAMVDQSTWWPEGSDSDSVAGSRALPVIWTDMEGILAKQSALEAAATNLQTAAGVDLASLQAAIGAVGGSCGGCHEAYRKPE
jgi:cytochrome c556